MIRKQCITISAMLVFVVSCGGGSDTDTNPAATDPTDSENTTPDISDTHLTDLVNILPYSGSISNNINQMFKVSGGTVGEIYVVTLGSDTVGTNLDLELYSDASFTQRFDYNSASYINDAIIYVEALGATLYMLIGDTFSTGSTIDYTVDVEQYDTYSGLIDISGNYPYLATTPPHSTTPYEVTGLLANTTYTITFSNVTNTLDILGSNEKMKMIDESYIPCSIYLTTSTDICTITTSADGELYLKVTNPQADTVSYEIDITL